MKFNELTEARYEGSEPIDEFYALYDLEKRRFIKENKSNQQNIFQRANTIRTTTLFNSKEHAEHELQSFKDRADRGIEFYSGERGETYINRDKLIAKLQRIRQYLEAVRVVKITANLTVL
jgi:hypothetical protein